MMDNDIAKAETAKEVISPTSVRCEFTRGFMWFFDAGDLMLSHFTKWLQIAFIIVLINVGLTYIPIIGDLVGMAIMFVQFAILLLAASMFDNNSEFKITNLMTPFLREKGLRLTGLALLIFVAAIGTGIVTAIAISATGIHKDTLLIVISMVFLIVMLSLWFTPALVTFTDMKVFDAVKTSAIATIKNIAPIIALCIPLFFILIVFGGLVISSDLISGRVEAGAWNTLVETNPIAGVILIIFAVLTTAFSGAIGYVSYRDVFNNLKQDDYTGGPTLIEPASEQTTTSYR